MVAGAGFYPLLRVNFGVMRNTELEVLQKLAFALKSGIGQRYGFTYFRPQKN